MSLFDYNGESKYYLIERGMSCHLIVKGYLIILCNGGTQLLVNCKKGHRTEQISLSLDF